MADKKIVNVSIDKWPDCLPIINRTLNLKLTFWPPLMEFHNTSSVSSIHTFLKW